MNLRKMRSWLGSPEPAVLVIFALLLLLLAAASPSRAVRASGPVAASDLTLLHFHGNVNDGCTGNGSTDVAACNGPFLLSAPITNTSPAAVWVVPDPALNGTADRNIYDPNWVWNLSAPTSLLGPMVVRWWGSCGGCGGPFSANWTIRVWADGVKQFEQVVSVSPALPNVAEVLSATVTIPTEIQATSKFVLQIDPVFADSQANTRIYYDSTAACPTSTQSGPCDSTVQMPAFATGGATPTLNPTGTATSTPSPTVTGSATATSTPSPTGTATSTSSPTATGSSTTTRTGTATLSSTATGTRTATATGTQSATPTGSATATSAASSTPTATRLFFQLLPEIFFGANP